MADDRYRNILTTVRQIAMKLGMMMHTDPLWTERDAVCRTDSCALKEPCISCGCTL